MSNFVAPKGGVLFVSHEASLTGAPIGLLGFMRWYRQNVGGPMSCLLLEGGPLQSEFEATCPTSVISANRWHKNARVRRLLKHLRLDWLGELCYRRSIMLHQLKTPALIYCNSVASSTAIDLLERLNSKILCHVHELDLTMRHFIGEQSVRKLLRSVHRTIACSAIVAKTLIERFDLSPDKLEVIYEYIPIDQTDVLDKQHSRLWVRNEVGISAQTFLVGASGQPGWRKGSDLFVQLAAIVRQMAPELDVHFVWIGGTPGSIEFAKLEYDIAGAGLQNILTLVATTSKPVRYFDGFDLFVLTSREDPFPRVCLEVAAREIPIVCFQGGGGMPEFVSDECGAIVPYLDLLSMATTTIAFLRDPERRARCGQAARNKVLTQHNLSIEASRQLEAMQKTINAQ